MLTFAGVNFYIFDLNERQCFSCLVEDFSEEHTEHWLDDRFNFKALYGISKLRKEPYGSFLTKNTLISWSC